MFDPCVVFCNNQREYGEFFTDEHAHQIQDQFPKGGTIAPIIIASDKSPVTRHTSTGNLEMHPMFVTIGNIQSDIRMAGKHRTLGAVWVSFRHLISTFTPTFRHFLLPCMHGPSLKHTALHGTAMTDVIGGSLASSSWGDTTRLRVTPGHYLASTSTYSNTGSDPSSVGNWTLVSMNKPL